MPVEAIIPVGQMSQVGAFDDFGGDVAERSSEICELVVRGMREFFCMKR